MGNLVPWLMAVLGHGRVREKSGFSEVKFCNVLSQGGFGAVYSTYDSRRGRSIAVKLELLKYGKGFCLDLENEAYLKLAGSCRVPQVYGLKHVVDQEGEEYLALSMERMGQSLQDLLTRYRPLSLKTVIQLGIQMLHAIEDVHKVGLVHRDVKPSNFVFGSRAITRDQDLCIIDFGTAAPYVDEETGEHLPLTRTGVVGTISLMSIRAHLGAQQSRQDDLISFFYTLIYLKCTILPWPHSQVPDPKEQLVKTFHIKEATSIETLCSGLPEEFRTLMAEIWGLGFEQEPKYEDYRILLKSCATREGMVLDWSYEWSVAKKNIICLM